MRSTPDSMDPYFRGRAWLHRGVTPENIARARLSFNRTHALDLENIYAIVGEAIACALAVALGPTVPAPSRCLPLQNTPQRRRWRSRLTLRQRTMQLALCSLLLSGRRRRGAL